MKHKNTKLIRLMAYPFLVDRKTDKKKQGVIQPAFKQSHQ